ncbi:hypothetical protein OHA70_13220 [Kribbella sp. NBC_00382]|uniref:hypothetical protein n=1 Tax=Kribbella sp. NBC_00382 TaxID=2975967 RepID=UPI002E1F10BF
MVIAVVAAASDPATNLSPYALAWFTLAGTLLGGLITGAIQTVNTRNQAHLTNQQTLRDERRVVYASFHQHVLDSLSVLSRAQVVDIGHPGRPTASEITQTVVALHAAQSKVALLAGEDVDQITTSTSARLADHLATAILERQGNIDLPVKKNIAALRLAMKKELGVT